VDATGIDDVVRRVQDAALGEPLGVLGFGELVVGRAGDDAALQTRDRGLGQHGAGRARREDVAPALVISSANSASSSSGLRAHVVASARWAHLPRQARDSGPPTAPTATVRPVRSSDPNARATAARRPWNTPTAVAGADVPEPPAASVRPNTFEVRSAITSMSDDALFMSHAVQYVPCIDSTSSP
jgi:hypothetical protein